MSIKLPSGLRRALRSSAIAAKARLLLTWRQRRVVDGLPVYAPNSAGSSLVRAQIAIESANQTFPLLSDLTRELDLHETFVTPVEFNASVEGHSASERLDELFKKHGSDKSSSHDYHHIYAHILTEVGPGPTILEIGLGSNNDDVPSNMGPNGRPGASLRAFRDFDAEALIYGADVDQRILFVEDRITTFYVDQRDVASVKRLADRLPDNLDLVIDDGLHSPHANIAVLLLAVSKLRPGGWVIIEDIAPDAAPVWEVIGSGILRGRFTSTIVEDRGAFVFAARMIV